MFCGKCGNNIGAEKFCGNCGASLAQMRGNALNRTETEIGVTASEDYFDINMGGNDTSKSNTGRVGTQTMNKEHQNSSARNNTFDNMNFDNIANEFDSKSFGEILKNLVLRPFEMSTKSFKNNLVMVITCVCILAIAIMGIVGELVGYIKMDSLSYMDFGDILALGATNVLNVTLFYAIAIGGGYLFISKVFKENLDFFEILNLFAGALIMHAAIRVVIFLAGILNIGILSSIGWGLIYLIVFPSLIINVIKASEKKTEVLYSLAGVMILGSYIVKQIIALF